MGASDSWPEHISLAQGELLDLLLADSAMPSDVRHDFRSLSESISIAAHLHYHHRLLELKRAYAPFDPDSDTASVLNLPEKERQRRLNDLYSDFAWLLDRAHFRHLGRDDLEPVLDSASHWGIRMDVDFGVFEHLAIFARGDAVQERQRRLRWRRWRTENAEVPVYRRLVLILKLRPHPRLRGPTDTSHVYLKVFKDIPKLDVMMLLPGARVHLSHLDRGRIGLPLISGLSLACIRILEDVTQWVQEAMTSPSMMWGLAAGGIGYGYRSFYGYQQTKQRYHLSLTQSLYFQNLDSNAGVLTRLLDEAEEQDGRLALLAYFCLWRHAPAEGWTGPDLDSAVELYLDRYADVTFACPPGACLEALRRLHLIEEGAGRARALPPPTALAAVRTAVLDQLPIKGCS